MAAARFTAFITTTLGIPLQVRQSLIDQGMTTVDDLLDYSDSEIRSLCKRMIQPGGTIPNPRANAAGQPTRIPNRGTTITYAQEKYLRMGAFYRRHLHKIQRDFVVANATRVAVKALWAERFELENPYKDYTSKETVSNPSPLTKVEDIRKTIEDLDHVLNLHTCRPRDAWVGLDCLSYG